MMTRSFERWKPELATLPKASLRVTSNSFWSPGNNARRFARLAGSGADGQTQEDGSESTIPEATLSVSASLVLGKNSSESSELRVH